MSAIKTRNHVTTPALVVQLSLQGFVACPAEPADLRAAIDTSCPKCRRLSVNCRAYERRDRYRLILSCPRCGWMEEA